MQVIVVGAGLIGAAAAFRLARAGAEVTVVEADAAGGAASASTFGWINASFHENETHYRLRLEGIAAWHRLQAELPDLPLTWPGCLWWEETGAAFEAKEAALRALGYPVERRGRAAVAAEVPLLGEVPGRALFFPAEGVVEGAEAARALLEAAGARVITGCPVERIETAVGRVTGVRIAGGVLRGDRVLVAAGTGSAALVAPWLDLPMLSRPAVILRTNRLPPVSDRVLVAPGLEFRQDAEGRIVGPTSPNHQADRAERIELPAEALAERAIARLRELLPGQDIRWERARLAWRPVPGDGLPVMGPLTEGLYLSVMHSGITLAALAGELAAAEITGTPSAWLSAYRPGRFAAGPRPA